MGRNSRRVIAKTLSDERSTTLVHCYATQGVGQWHHAPVPSDVMLVLVNEARQVREVEGRQVEHWVVRTDAVGYPSGWLILGWRMADASLPHGPLDAVDPLMADLDKLPEVNRPRRASY